MIIGIDGNEANLKNRVGVNEYGFNLLWALSREVNKSKSDRVIVFLNSEPQEDLPQATDYWRYEVISGSRLWILTKMMPRLITNQYKLDVYFAPSHYLPLFSRVPMICSIMDLGYLESSAQFKKTDFWQLKYWSAISVTISKKIIAISEATAKDIVRHHPFASKKVEITYPAHDSEKYNLKISEIDVRRIKSRYSIVGDYILFLSTLKPSKNAEGLLDAFALAIKSNPKLLEKYKLVIVGKKGWMFQSIFEKVEKLGLVSKVIFTDFIPDSDKAPLIKGATVLVSPSFWEGFGIHILEAMASGVPVIVSNRGSLPEVVENTGLIIDPESTEQISKAIVHILSLPKKDYNEMVRKGTFQAGKFNWAKTAEKTLQILRSVKNK